LKTTKPIVIYHGNCADGFGAAWCFWHKYKDEYDYFPGTYGGKPPDVTDRDVYLVDFSYKKDVVLDLLSKAKFVTLIDHHKSAIEDLQDIDHPKFHMYVDLNMSGATLAWKYLFPYDRRPILLDHIEDRDLWKFKLTHTREIQAAVFSYDYSFELWDDLMLGGEIKLVDLMAQGIAIERKHHKEVKEIVRVCARLMTIGGYTVPVASLPYTMGSDGAGFLAIGQPFAAYYWDTATTRSFGLRSALDGLDVSLIAMQYGGGGHKHASGFKVPRDHELARA
jgi:oligoribonuclease NrnB/cAMP/cGMP phosphodiesterase (DHH superfamily)